MVALVFTSTACFVPTDSNCPSTSDMQIIKKPGQTECNQRTDGDDFLRAVLGPLPVLLSCHSILLNPLCTAIVRLQTGADRLSQLALIALMECHKAKRLQVAAYWA